MLHVKFLFTSAGLLGGGDARARQEAHGPGIPAPGRETPAARRGRRQHAGRFVAVLVLAVLAGCSRAPEPVTGVGGLRFGQVRPADCAALAVPLPRGLAEKLAYCAPPGGGGEFAGAALAETTLGFFEGRFFAAAAVLAEPAEADALGRRLTERLGRPYCRDGAGLAVCLWRGGEADVVLETPAAGPPRLLVRHRPLAEKVAALGGEVAAPGLADAPAGGDAATPN